MGDAGQDSARVADGIPDEGLTEPHLPPPAIRGRTRRTSLRDVVNAIHYIAESGCQWRLLPKDFPPYSTVHRQFCQIASNSDPLFASNRDPSTGATPQRALVRAYPRHA